MSVFQTKVKKEYEQKGYKVLKIIKLAVNGYPDLMCLKNGKVIFIECKEKNDTLKELQKFIIDDLIKNGFDAFCLQDTKGKIYPNETTKN
jgi:Holliday junction resolvase